MKYIGLEFRKTKRLGIPLLISCLWLFQVSYLFIVTTKQDSLEQGWLLQLYNLPLINAIMLPTFLSLIASRLIDVEHKANSFKLLETLENKKHLFFSKLFIGFFYIFIFAIAQCIFALKIGNYFNFKGSPDITMYLLHFFNTFLVSLILLTIQMILSLIFKNQAISICIGLCGSMAGYFLLFMPRNILYYLIPWSFYGSTMFVGMDWDIETRICSFYRSNTMSGIYFALLLWLLISILFGLKLYTALEIDGFSLKIKSKKNKKSTLSSTHLPIEFIKLKRSPIWIAFFILPTISAIIGTFNYTANIDILKDYWYSLWSQHTLFFCYFFMPPLIGVYCSYLWRLEHTGSNWNQLLTLDSPIKIFGRKLLSASFINILTLLFVAGLYVICGKIISLDLPIPSELFGWIICGILGSISICTIQLFFSLIIRNFAVPIGISFIGSIVGLLLVSKGKLYFLPYSLFSVGMRANNPLMNIDTHIFLLSNIIFILIFYSLSVLYLKKNDVITS